jgi:hypothetical protein
MNLFISKHTSFAKEIFATSRLLSISSLNTFLNKIPDMDELIQNSNDTKHWDFFMTIAGVHASYMSSNSFFIDNSSNFLKAINKTLEKWDYRAAVAFTDLSNFISTSKSKDLEYSLKLGSWVIWNIKGSQPSDSDYRIAQLIGNYWVDTFFQWWDNKTIK